MRRSFVACAVVAVLAAGGTAPASHDCAGTVTDVGGTAYIDDRGVADGELWFYLESNGVAGLQRGGTSEVFGHSDYCYEHDEAGNRGLADTLIY